MNHICDFRDVPLLYPDPPLNSTDILGLKASEESRDTPKLNKTADEVMRFAASAASAAISTVAAPVTNVWTSVQN
jgi:hypothetical protein